MAKTEIRASIDPVIKRGLDALATATNRSQGEIIEQALRLVLDPLPVLAEARALIEQHRQERIILADKIDLIADTIIDRMRADETA